MAKPRIRMENAPDWYDTPLDQLHFEWSKEEKLEIERYCEKIHKNIAEEEMTPRQRFAATIAGKEKDRVFYTPLPFNVYTTHMLDSGAHALKPIDLYRNPKLEVKAHLAFTARFKMDCLYYHSIAYAEDMWGAKSKLIEYGNPCMIGEPPVKTMEDLEGMEIPSARKNGLYPGYLWGVREIKKILVEYDLDDKLEFQGSTCPDPVSIAMLGMMSISGFCVAARRNPEVCKKAVELAYEFYIDYNQAVIDCGAHSMWICHGLGWLPLKGNEWVLDWHVKGGKYIGPKIPTIITASSPGCMQWFDLMVERGIMGPGSYAGWAVHRDLDMPRMINGARKANIYVGPLFDDKILLNGPASAIEEDIKHLMDLGKSYPKFAMTTSSIDYWVPQSHVDIAVAAMRKYGKY